MKQKYYVILLDIKEGYIYFPIKKTNRVFGGMPQFFGGNKEDEESVLDCLKREANEESDGTVTLNKIHGQSIYSNRVKSNTYTFFVSTDFSIDKTRAFGKLENEEMETIEKLDIKNASGILQNFFSLPSNYDKIYEFLESETCEAFYKAFKYCCNQYTDKIKKYDYVYSKDNSTATLFPQVKSKSNYSLSSKPILLNSMKVIFDQSASVYPITLQPKIMPAQLRDFHLSFGKEGESESKHDKKENNKKRKSESKHERDRKKTKVNPRIKHQVYAVVYSKNNFLIANKNKKGFFFLDKNNKDAIKIIKNGQELNGGGSCVFPGGGLNDPDDNKQDEKDRKIINGAIKEFWEETGYDLSELYDLNKSGVEELKRDKKIEILDFDGNSKRTKFKYYGVCFDVSNKIDLDKLKGIIDINLKNAENFVQLIGKENENIGKSIKSIKIEEENTKKGAKINLKIENLKDLYIPVDNELKTIDVIEITDMKTTEKFFKKDDISTGWFYNILDSIINRNEKK